MEGRTHGFAVEIEDLSLDRVRGARTIEENIHHKGTVGPRVNRHAFDELGRHCLEIDRAVDAAEDPVIALTLGAVDRIVGRQFVHGHFEQVFPAEGQEFS